MGLTLRPYQEEAIEAVRGRFRQGERRALLVLCTGAGKTITALSMATRTVDRGGRVLWLAHRSELLTQPIAALAGIPDWTTYADRSGIVQAEQDEADRALVFASIGTVGGKDGDRMGRILAHGVPSLVVVDECHHSVSPTWRAAIGRIDEAAGREVHRLGLTATPERTDRNSLAAMWGDAPAYVYSTQDGIDEGYLCPPRFVVDQPEGLEMPEDLDDEEAVSEALARVHIVEHTVKAMRRHVVGRHAIVFTVNVKQATETAQALCANGWRAAVISGNTPDSTRRALLRDFERGAVDALCNCAVLTEGTDLPICDAIVAARPFSSKPLWIQSVGRGLRRYPGKEECIVLDLAGASSEHGILHAPTLLDTEKPEADPDAPKPLRPFVASRPLLLGGAMVPVNGKVMGRYVDDSHEMMEPSLDPARLLQIPRDVRPDGADRNAFAGMFHERSRVEAEWVKVPNVPVLAWAVDIGEHGAIYLVEGAEGYTAFHVKKRGRTATPLNGRPAPLGIAQALGDDAFRQAQGLVRRGATWRARPASDKQIAYAERLGLHLGFTPSAGDAATAITAAKAASALARLGLVQ